MADMEPVSFWQLLTQYRVVIPIIQRDYAQGRPGRETLRQLFLDDIFAAFANEGEKPLVLDFVYGSEALKNGCLHFYPLDGQQRLTMLWLVHWYLAFMAGAGEEAATLRKFSYETRYSSRVFCERLCEAIKTADAPRESLPQWIRAQRWFFSSWQQDPTIAGMICVLGDIESRFGRDAKAACGYWKRCRQQNAPIVFHKMLVGSSQEGEKPHLPLTDDLYIKMNARGKPLSSFENFKADLLDYIAKKELDPGSDTTSFGHLLDTGWTDIFWKFRSDTPTLHIDEIWMEFFRRFFFCWYIARAGKTKDAAYETLEPSAGNRGQKPPMVYHSFAAWQMVLESGSAKACIGALYTCLCRFAERYQREDRDAIAARFLPGWEGEERFSFIPRYAEGSLDVRTITWRQHAVFYGICVYLMNCGSAVEDEKLADWMRFVWNMAENSIVDQPEDQTINLIRVFDKIAGWAPDVMECLEKLYDDDTAALSNCWSRVEGILGRKFDAATRQLHEEICKARQIVSPRAPGKAAILEAERHAFFKGAIAFLFMNEEGRLDAWDGFWRKGISARRFFDAEGVKKACGEEVLRIFLSWCQDESQLRNDKKVFNTWARTWKHQIMNRLNCNYYTYAAPLHQLLSGAGMNPQPDPLAALLVQGGLVAALLDPNLRPEYTRRCQEREMYIRYERLYYCGNKLGAAVFLNRPFRDELLSQEGICLQDEKARIKGCTLLWGHDIPFMYRNRNVRMLWKEDGQIHRCDDAWQELETKVASSDLRELPEPLEELLNRLA